ncbi:MAG: aminodeoxychorismate lyase [Gammaproteobacteria bacterium]|nr:aminodeoxychorismate lyase [Gammaproteobacteria bacterium]
MNLPALINGKSADTIPITDRGLQYGDGLFETVAVVENRLLCWDEHLTRLQDGCRRLNIEYPGSRQLTDEAQQLATASERAVLRLTLTRGSGGRGYAPPPGAVPSRILSLHPWPDYPAANREHGVNVRLCMNRLASNPLLAGMKHLNRLEQVLARGEWDDPAIAEGLMLDQAGNVIEGTMSNLFVVRQNALMTPDVSQAGIAGIIRGRVLALATEMDIDAMIATLDLHDIETADELFLCNSLIGIWPVCGIGDKKFTPGPWTHAIRDRLIQYGYVSPD